MLTFAPRLPARLDRLVFRVLVGGRCLKVEVTKREACYELQEGEALEIAHFGAPLTLAAGRRAVCEIPPLAERPAPDQPAGRRPARRRPAEETSLRAA